MSRSRDTNKYKYKKNREISRRDKKQKREKFETNFGKENYASM
jgi:hypothetical protein